MIGLLQQTRMLLCRLCLLRKRQLQTAAMDRHRRRENGPRNSLASLKSSAKGVSQTGKLEVVDGVPSSTHGSPRERSCRANRSTLHYTTKLKVFSRKNGKELQFTFTCRSDEIFYPYVIVAVDFQFEISTNHLKLKLHTAL